MIKLTGDGSQTLLHPVIGDSYHSLNGAVTESLHIYIGAGLMSVEQSEVSILEVGFGSGLNAQLTLEDVSRSERVVKYSTIELYPIEMSLAEEMEYAKRPHFLELHKAKWEEWVEITPRFHLMKINANVVGIEFNALSGAKFDLVYFDAFAPDSQPELWSEEVFRALYAAMNSGGVLVTYSSKGLVKRALRSVGFEVKRLEGPVGKRHIIRAVKR